MSKFLALSAFLLMPGFAALADDGAAKTVAAAPSSAESEQANADDKLDRSYCVSETGTHLTRKDDVCVHGVSMSRTEWEQRGGMTTSDFVRKALP